MEHDDKIDARDSGDGANRSEARLQYRYLFEHLIVEVGVSDS